MSKFINFHMGMCYNEFILKKQEDKGMTLQECYEVSAEITKTY